MINAGINTEIAMQVGVNAAFVFEKIRYFCESAKLKNDAYKFHDGRYWTYCSAEGWTNSLPFLSAKQITLAINILVEKKYILIGNYNKSKYDRTRWYTILVTTETSICPVGQMHVDERDKWNCPDGQMELPHKANQFALEGEPIPKESSKESSKESNIYIAQSPSDDVSKFDFESLYKKYPRKEGKTRGLKICKTQIKTMQDFDKLSQSIDNYSIHVRARVKDSSFIKHFSTFMGEWRDWIEIVHNSNTPMTEDQLKEFYGVK